MIGRNEGRLRPSLIAASLPPPPPVIWGKQRGAASPLPHCGPATTLTFAPGERATRGGFAPPSLRPSPGHPRLPVPRINEGRLRPSLIAAGRGRAYHRGRLGQRGAASPLPHCGSDALDELPSLRMQRGAASPLPHCGGADGVGGQFGAGYNEGRLRPSLIAAYFRRAGCAAYPANEGRLRPSLIAACLPPFYVYSPAGTTRGGFAPPSLRRVSEVGTPQVE